jgi:hypothetical protein
VSGAPVADAAILPSPRATCIPLKSRMQGAEDDRDGCREEPTTGPEGTGLHDEAPLGLKLSDRNQCWKCDELSLSVSKLWRSVLKAAPSGTSGAARAIHAVTSISGQPQTGAVAASHAASRYLARQARISAVCST